MRRYFRLHRIFIAQYLKKLMEYKVDFLLGAIGLLLTQAIQIMFLGIIFSQIPALIGYTFPQILFIYGFSLIAKSLDHLFTDNLWMVGYRIIRKGEFDKFTAKDATYIFVTNEIGMGGVSENAVQRKFTDLQGWMNQYVASKADEVILMVSGIPVKVKG